MQRAHIDKAGRPQGLVTINDQQGTIINTGVSQRIFQMAHDIQSPLTALSIMANICDELDEEKKSVLTHTVDQIQYMMKNLLDEYTCRNTIGQKEEMQQIILCSDFINQILREKKYQYFHCPVSFERQFSKGSQTLTICAQPNQFRRTISNLINNAVDSVKDQKDGKVLINLGEDATNVKICIQDNGKGMSASTKNKLCQRKAFTEGKDNGHGLGMGQVWDMIEANSGEIIIQSKLRKGSTFELIFPKA